MDDLVRLGTLTRQAARFLEAAVASGLNVLVAGGTQAGKTTLLNCLASAVPARERIVTCEEVFELRIPHRDVASMQCRQPSLEGTGEIPLRRLVKEALRMRPSRIIVGEVRQAESLDLLIALNSGLPGHVHDPRQQRPRGRDEDVHAAAAGRRERLRAVRRADRGRVHRPRRARGPRAGRPSHGARDRRRAGPRGGRRRRDRRPVRPPWWRARAAPTGSRRTRTASSGRATTCPRCSPRGPRDRPAARAHPRRWACSSCGGAAGCRRRRPTASRAAGPLDRLSDEIVQAGFAGLSVRTLLGLVCRRRCCSCWRSSTPTVGVLPIAVCFAVMAAYAPLAVVRGRARRRRARLRDLWPDAVDNITSGVRAGMALPEALTQLGDARAGGAARAVRGLRRRLPPDGQVPRLASTGSRTGSATRSATASSRACGSRARSAAPTSDTSCAPCPASCARTPAPAPSSRPGSPGRSTPRGSPSPRRGRCSRCCRRTPSRWPPTRPRSGWLVLAVGAAVTAVAYWAMVRIGRLPEDERVLR